MGLDMYACVTTETLDTPVDFAEPTTYEVLHQWRKHDTLHEWMETLYQVKGGLDEDFNLSPVALDNADIDRLEAAISAGALPQTRRSYFGNQNDLPREDDLIFVAKARAALAAGWSIYYIAWW